MFRYRNDFEMGVENDIRHPTLENLMLPCSGGEKGAKLSLFYIFHHFLLRKIWKCSSLCSSTLPGIFFRFLKKFPSKFFTQSHYQFHADKTSKCHMVIDDLFFLTITKERREMNECGKILKGWNKSTLEEKHTFSSSCMFIINDRTEKITML